MPIFPTVAPIELELCFPPEPVPAGPKKKGRGKVAQADRKTEHTDGWLVQFYRRWTRGDVAFIGSAVVLRPVEGGFEAFLMPFAREESRWYQARPEAVLSRRIPSKDHSQASALEAAGVLQVTMTATYAATLRLQRSFRRSHSDDLTQTQQHYKDLIAGDATKTDVALLLLARFLEDKGLENDRFRDPASVLTILLAKQAQQLLALAAREGWELGFAGLQMYLAQSQYESNSSILWVLCVKTPHGPVMLPAPASMVTLGKAATMHCPPDVPLETLLLRQAVAPALLGMEKETLKNVYDRAGRLADWKKALATLSPQRREALANLEIKRATPHSKQELVYVQQGWWGELPDAWASRDILHGLLGITPLEVSQHALEHLRAHAELSDIPGEGYQREAEHIEVCLELEEELAQPASAAAPKVVTLGGDKHGRVEQARQVPAASDEEEEMDEADEEARLEEAALAQVEDEDLQDHVGQDAPEVESLPAVASAQEQPSLF